MTEQETGILQKDLNITTTTRNKSQPTSNAIFQWRSLKTRVTISTLAIFLVGIWSLAFYASYTLKNDMERALGEQQFSTVSVEAAEINVGLSESDRVKDAQRIGAGAYVPKPYVLERLGIAVSRELARK